MAKMKMERMVMMPKDKSQSRIILHGVGTVAQYIIHIPHPGSVAHVPQQRQVSFITFLIGPKDVSSSQNSSFWRKKSHKLSEKQAIQQIYTEEDRIEVQDTYKKSPWCLSLSSQLHGTAFNICLL